MFRLCNILNYIHDSRVSHYLDWNCFMAGIVGDYDVKEYFDSGLYFCYHSPPLHINPLINEVKLNLKRC